MQPVGRPTIGDVEPVGVGVGVGVTGPHSPMSGAVGPVGSEEEW